MNILIDDLDETYEYDNLDRLVEWALGGSTQKTWTLDALGNDLASGSYNAANEETPSTGSSGYDAAGNMITLQSGNSAIYDAWNRMTEVDNGSAIVEKYSYDGTNRRVQIFSNYTGSAFGTVVDDYHNGQQVVQSYTHNGSGVFQGGHQFLWSPRYIDAPILRDSYDSSGTFVAGDRILYLGDANYNVTGLLKYNSGTSTWQVVERYTYTPYGVVTYRNADWTTATSSANSNTTLYTGRLFDLLTSLYYYRARFYDAGLGRFVNRDPIAADVNLYRYCGNDPTNGTDPDGVSGHGGRDRREGKGWSVKWAMIEWWMK